MKQLRNQTEDAVKDYLDKWYPESGACQCEGCRIDVMAIMLNNLKQRYVVTDTGALYAHIEDYQPQQIVDFMTEMTQAIKVINSRPRHVERPLPNQE